MIEVYGVPQDRETITWLWANGFGQGIQMALDKASDGETGEEVLQDLLDNLLVGWVAMQDNKILAVMTSYITENRGHTKAVIKHCAGVDMRHWLEFYPLVEEWARDHGAEKIQVHGRAGWARVLDRHGFEPKYVTLEKTL